MLNNEGGNEWGEVTLEAVKTAAESQGRGWTQGGGGRGSGGSPQLPSTRPIRLRTLRPREMKSVVERHGLMECSGVNIHWTERGAEGQTQLGGGQDSGSPVSR